MAPSLLEQFTTKLESLAGHAVVAESWEKATQQVWRICQDTGASCVAFARVPQPLQAAVEDLCKESGVKYLKPPYPEAALPGSIDAAQVGITGAEFAIAQTGTVVEVALNDATRLVSSLPRTHIAVVSESNFVEALDDAAPRLRKILVEHDKHCVISFLSGPSRTGDIEVTLTLGVHGPEATHVIILADALGAENGHG